MKADLDHLAELLRENPEKLKRTLRWLAGTDEQVDSRWTARHGTGMKLK